MKKILAVLLVLVVLFSFAACQKNPDSNINNSTPSNSQTQNPTDNNKETTNTTDAPNNEVNATNWGVSERCSAQSSTSESFYINFPKFTGYSEGCGLVAEQLDDTMVIVSGQNDKCPEIGSLSELFPAYFDHLQFTLEGIYGILSDNYKFSLKTNTSETVGDYNMHKFVGEIEFDNDGEHVKYAFVAYAAALKSNGANAYWVVYDTSKDQSKSQLIAEHALNMAKTFREEQ